MNTSDNEGLTVLSFGGGQDSTTILYKIMHDQEFRAKYVRGEFIVIMADTGNEYPDTYDHIRNITELCKVRKILFYFLTKDMGYHARTWQSLPERWALNNSISSTANIRFKKVCTNKLKIEVIYRFLEHYIAEKGYPFGRKRGVRQYASEHGKIRVMLGIAKGEERRVAGNKGIPKWMEFSIERTYPLMEIGYGRQECQDYMGLLGYYIPLPSNCMMCHFQGKQEILYLYRFHREDYDRWVQFEQNKIDACAAKGLDPKKNLGARGKKLLPQLRKEAEEEFGHWSDYELREFKMSHGHCITNAY